MNQTDMDLIEVVERVDGADEFHSRSRKHASETPTYLACNYIANGVNLHEARLINI
jgi:hypothetical protein